MRAPELENLIQELKAWAEQKRGRQSELARELEVSRHLVNDWLSSRRPPTLDQYFALQAFLRKQRQGEVSRAGVMIRSQQKRPSV